MSFRTADQGEARSCGGGLGPRFASCWDGGMQCNLVQEHCRNAGGKSGFSAGSLRARACCFAAALVQLAGLKTGGARVHDRGTTKGVRLPQDLDCTGTAALERQFAWARFCSAEPTARTVPNLAWRSCWQYSFVLGGSVAAVWALHWPFGNIRCRRGSVLIA